MIKLELTLLRRASAVSALCLALASSCAPSTGGDDAGPTDAGADEEDAGDGDGGSDACADLDPALGSLTLGDGFSVVESVPLPGSVSVLRVVEEGAARRLYGLDTVQNAVVDLGQWPNLAPVPPKVFSVFPPDLDDEGAAVSWFLAHDGTRLAAGYTGSFDTETFLAPGEIALYDLTQGVAEPLTYIGAANNYAAEFVGQTLVLHAATLGALDEGTAIYALDDEEPLVLARYEDPTGTFGGPLVATRGGGLVVSGFVSETGLQHFFLLPAPDVTGALEGEALSLADAEEVLAAPALVAARFGDDLAYVHGDVFSPVEALRRVPLDDGAARDPVDVLTFNDDCTTVELLAPLDDDLLVSVWDAAGGLRLVRIREDG